MYCHPAIYLSLFLSQSVHFSLGWNYCVRTPMCAFVCALLEWSSRGCIAFGHQQEKVVTKRNFRSSIASCLVGRPGTRAKLAPAAHRSLSAHRSLFAVSFIVDASKRSSLRNIAGTATDDIESEPNEPGLKIWASRRRRNSGYHINHVTQTRSLPRSASCSSIYIQESSQIAVDTEGCVCAVCCAVSKPCSCG